jgi:hypothetical protein
MALKHFLLVYDLNAGKLIEQAEYFNGESRAISASPFLAGV